jgi:hypothetical protein
MTYKEWANRYLCKWWISTNDAYNDIIDAIKNDKPLSFTRFGDGELFLVKEYFRRIKNNSEHITMCNADLLVDKIPWLNYPDNTLNFYTNRHHQNLCYDFYTKTCNLSEGYDVNPIVDRIGNDIILALQGSSHIGISNIEDMVFNASIDDFYLYKHSYMPHIQLFVDCGVDFKKITDVNVYRNSTFLNPFLFKDVLNGKSVHIITSNENELKNIIKLNEILNTKISYTNLTPVHGDLSTYSFMNHEYLYDKCSEITEPIVLFGLGAGAKHIPSYLMKSFNKTVIDLGSVLDLWAGKKNRE